MKLTRLFQNYRRRWYWLSVPGVWMAASPAWAAETNAPPVTDTNAPPAAVPAAAPAPKPLTPQQMFEGGETSYNNWVEVSTGGYFQSGNQAQFQQGRHTSGGAFGGVTDFHYQDELAKGTTLAVDGRGLFNNHDYKLSLDLQREKLGYLKFSYAQFRTWYNGDGGFYQPTGAFYKSPSEDALALDRGKLTFEGGLTLANYPNITFKYTHDFREGDKSSTSWGSVHPAVGVTQGLSPSFRDIQEHSDSFALDVTHHIKATEFGVGLRYETGRMDDALKISQYPGEPIAQKITDRQGTSYDLLNAHAFTETWLSKKLMFSTGYSYTESDADFFGSRVYGSDFDVSYVPAGQNGTGYTTLGGASRLHEYVTDLNLFYKPAAHLTVVPSVRVQKAETDGSAGGYETQGANAAVPFTSWNTASDLDVRERLDVTYNGITNWVLYARGDWTEGSGNLSENGGLVPVGGIGVAPVQRQTDDSRLFQKYSAGARWYPLRNATIDAGGYYKYNQYDYTHNIDSTPNNSGNRYPAYLVMQNFRTYDSNLRLTLRPLSNVTLVSRYEWQWSTINTQPDQISGLGNTESSTMTSHILAQDVSWSPWSRLFLQAGVNYVRSETKTPASDETQAILNAKNNYWSLNFSSGLVLDNKTDLNLSYFYYRANDYQNNASFGVPLGSGVEEHGVTATLVRRLTKNVRLSLKYGYFHNHDQMYGDNNDYTAHMVYTSLLYRF